MTSFPYARGIRLFDHPKFAEPLRGRIREPAQEVCAASGVSIEHVNKSHIRKEDRVARVLAARGNAPGLVHLVSAMVRLSQPRVGTDPSVKGLNFFDAAEQALLRTLQHGEFNIHGWRRADLVARLPITPSARRRAPPLQFRL